MTDPRDPNVPTGAEAHDQRQETPARHENAGDDPSEALHRMSMRLGNRVKRAGTGTRTFLRLME